MNPEDAPALPSEFFSPPDQIVTKDDLLEVIQRNGEAGVEVDAWENEQGIFLRVKSPGCDGYAECQGSALMVCGGVAQRCNLPVGGNLLDTWKIVLSPFEKATPKSFISVLYLLEGTWTKMRLTLRKVVNKTCNASQRELDGDYAFVSDDDTVIWSLASAAAYFYVNCHTSRGHKDYQPKQPHPDSIYLDHTKKGYVPTHSLLRRVSERLTKMLAKIPFALALSRNDIHLSNVEASALKKVSLDILPFVLQCVVYKSPLNPEQGTDVLELATDTFWNESKPEWELMREYLRLNTKKETWDQMEKRFAAPAFLARLALGGTKALVPRTSHIYLDDVCSTKAASMYLRAELDSMAMPLVDCGQYGVLDVVRIMQTKLKTGNREPLTKESSGKDEDGGPTCKSIIMACKDSYLRMEVNAIVDTESKQLSVQFTNFKAAHKLAAEVKNRELSDADACATAVLASGSTHVQTLKFVLGEIGPGRARALIAANIGIPSGMSFKDTDVMAVQYAQISEIVSLLGKAKGDAEELQAAFVNVGNADLVKWAINRAFNVRASRINPDRLGVYSAEKMAEKTDIAYIDERTQTATLHNIAAFFANASEVPDVFENKSPKVQNYLIDTMFKLIKAVQDNKQLKRYKITYGGAGFWLQCGYGAPEDELEKSNRLLELCKNSDAKKSAKAILATEKKEHPTAPNSAIKLRHLWQIYKKIEKPTESFSAYINKNYSRTLVDFPDCSVPGQFNVGDMVVHGQFGSGKIRDYDAGYYIVEFGDGLTDVDPDDLRAGN
jgi:hypothetical protein